jgi:phosphoribosyl-ATP pyrophosphohydrolase
MADLWFHCMVLLDHAGVDHADVLSELERRAGTSGLDEKRARKSVSE